MLVLEGTTPSLASQSFTPRLASTSKPVPTSTRIIELSYSHVLNEPPNIPPTPNPMLGRPENPLTPSQALRDAFPVYLPLPGSTLTVSGARDMEVQVDGAAGVPSRLASVIFAKLSR